MIECKLKLEYEDKKTAKVIGRSIEPDNEDYVDMEFIGSTLSLKVKDEKPLRLLQTVDDLLACVTIAEETEDID